MAPVYLITTHDSSILTLASAGVSILFRLLAPFTSAECVPLYRVTNDPAGYGTTAARSSVAQHEIIVRTSHFPPTVPC